MQILLSLVPEVIPKRQKNKLCDKMRKAACVMNFTLFLEIVLIVSLSIVMQGTLGRKLAYKNFTSGIGNHFTIINFKIVEDEVSCSLSNNRGTSTCIRAHRCDSFAAIFRQSAGNLSPRDKQYIQSHECNRKVCQIEEIIF